MTIPEFQSYMLPLLELSSDGEIHTSQEAYQVMADRFEVSPEERQQLLPSGNQPLLNNRVAWALTYLRQAGLVHSPKRGQFQITDDGRNLLAERPSKVNIKTLERYPAFIEFKKRTSDRSRNDKSQEGHKSEPGTFSSGKANEEETPEDTLIRSWKAMRSNLEAELLHQVKSSSPAFLKGWCWIC